MILDDTFTTPIGAVPVVNSSALGTYRGPVYEQVIGKGGSVRHAGSFSDDNEAYQQLLAAQAGGAKNQDLDALYEKAVNWEIDRANLLEQREYDDPVNQVARQKAAGINPDLANSGSGSTSSGSSAVQPQTQGQTHFANSYDNTNLVMNGVNTALNAVNAFASFGSALTGCIDTLATLPGRAAIISSAANLASSTLDASIAAANLAPKKLESDIDAQDASTAAKNQATESQRIANYNSRMQLVPQLAEMFTPDMLAQDDGAAMLEQVLGFMGIDGDQFDTFHQMIGNYHNNPKMKALFSSMRHLEAQQSALADTHTQDVYTKLYNDSIAIKELENDFAILHTGMQVTIQEILADSGFAQAEAGNILQSQNVTGDNLLTQLSSNKAQRSMNTLTEEQISLAREKLSYDAEVFTNSIFEIKNQITSNYQAIDKIVQNAKDNDRDLTAAEKAMITAYQSNCTELITLGSNQLHQCYQTLRRFGTQQYTSSFMVNKRGKLNKVTGKSNEISFARFNFQQILQGDISDQQLTKSYIELGVDAYTHLVSAAAAAAN